MTIDRHRPGPRFRRGFTLAEATLAMVLLGLAATGILLPFSGGAAVQAEGMHRTLGAMLANDLMERIAGTPFGDIVTRYGDHLEPQGQVEDAGETPYTDPMYANFSREAKCKYVYTSQQGGEVAPNFILATVRVAYLGRDVATVHRLISE